MDDEALAPAVVDVKVVDERERGQAGNGVDPARWWWGGYSQFSRGSIRITRNANVYLLAYVECIVLSLLPLFCAL